MYFWIIVCTFSVKHATKKHTLPRMKVLNSQHTDFSNRFAKKFENQCKSRRVRFTHVLQCFFIQTIFAKHIKLQTSRFLVKHSVFLASLALFLVFYSVNFVWCKICIFLVFYSHSRRQCQQIGTNALKWEHKSA